MGKLYEDQDGDLMYVSDAGVWYELQDTVTTRSGRKPDIIHMMVSYAALEDYDEFDDLYDVLDQYGINPDDASYAGYFWGSSYFLEEFDNPEVVADTIDTMEYIANKFEHSHPEVVDLFSGVPVLSSWNLVA